MFSSIIFHQEDIEKMETMEKEQKLIEAQKKLFQGLKFFLNREVPRESLAFVIRWVRAAAVRVAERAEIMTRTILNLNPFSMFCAFQVFRWRGVLGQICVHWQHVRDDRWDHHTSNRWQTQLRQTVHQQVKKRLVLNVLNHLFPFRHVECTSFIPIRSTVHFWMHWTGSLCCLIVLRFPFTLPQSPQCILAESSLSVSPYSNPVL